MNVQAFLARARIRALFEAFRREQLPHTPSELPIAELRPADVDQEGRKLVDLSPCRDAVTDLLRGAP